MARMLRFRAVMEVTCPACGCGALGREIEARELAAQAEQAFRFHKRRLRKVDRELEERASFTQDPDAALLGCPECGLLLRWPRAKPGELIETYAEERYPDERFAEMVAAQVSLFRRKVPLLRGLLGGRTRLLEVGSFLGGFLEVARTAGFDALGVDPNHQLAESSRERDLRVYEGTLEQLLAEHESLRVDGVLIWNTFDQLADPRPVLAGATRALHPGGLLALRVPNGAGYRALLDLHRHARRPARRFWEACLGWNNLLSFPYLNGYTLTALDRLVAPFGFERVAACGDVLCLLSGRATRGWARAEERAVKQVQMTWIRHAERWRGRRLPPPPPWLDVYYRLAPFSA